MNLLNRFRDVRNREQAFSLIELSIAIVLLGIIAAIAIPIFAGQDGKVKTEQVRIAMQQASMIIEKETIDNNGLYPTYMPNEMKQDSLMSTFTYTYPTSRLAWCLSAPSPEGTLYYDSAGAAKGTTLPPCGY